MADIIKNKFTWKDAIVILGFLIMAAGWLTTRGNLIAENALLKNQVQRNTQELERYDLGLIDYQLKEIKQSLDELKVLIKEK